MVVIRVQGDHCRARGNQNASCRVGRGTRGRGSEPQAVLARRAPVCTPAGLVRIMAPGSRPPGNRVTAPCLFCGISNWASPRSGILEIRLAAVRRPGRGPDTNGPLGPVTTALNSLVAVPQRTMATAQPPPACRDFFTHPLGRPSCLRSRHREASMEDPGSSPCWRRLDLVRTWPAQQRAPTFWLRPAPPSKAQ